MSCIGDLLARLGLVYPKGEVTTRTETAQIDLSVCTFGQEES